MDSKKKIALLCDYGLDDAIATLYLFEHAESFDAIDILPIAGNFPLERTLVNAKRILSHAEKIPGNIRIVDTSSVKQKHEELYDIHGCDGMGGILPDSYEDCVATVDYETWINEIDDNYTIVSLGPTTVPLDIMSRKSGIPLLMMGGSISQPSNYKGYEFNHGMDPESFSECVKFPHVIATLDTCHSPYCALNSHELQTDTLLKKLICRYREFCNSRNESICSVYDLVAIVYLVHPEKFEVSFVTDKDSNNLCMLRYIDNQPMIQEISADLSSVFGI